MLELLTKAARSFLKQNPGGVPGWIEPEHLVGFLLSAEEDPESLTAAQIGQKLQASLFAAIFSGKKASDLVAEAAGFKKVADVIPFDPDRRKALRKDEADLRKVRKEIALIRSGGHVPNLTMEGALSVERALVRTIRNKKKLL